MKFDYDYRDTFLIKTKKDSLSIEEVTSAFFLSGPKWIDVLFKLRNLIVAPLGLKVSNENRIIINYPLVIGEKIGFFEIFEINKTKVILGADDGHLDFRVSIEVIDGNKVSTDTLVKYNNRFGKIYFQIIKPFHKVIVASMLKGMLNKLDI